MADPEIGVPENFDAPFVPTTFDDPRTHFWNRAEGGTTALDAQSNAQVRANPHFSAPAGTSFLWSYLNPAACS